MIRIKNFKKDPIILLKIIFFISLIIVTANTIIYFSEKFIFGDRFLFDDLLMITCIIVQDINLPFLLSAISFFYIIFYSFKNVDVLGISYGK